MHIFAMLLMLIMTTTAFAETEISAAMEKGKVFFAGSMEKLLGSKDFPFKHYKTPYTFANKILLINSSDKNFNLKPYNIAFFEMTLDLIDYDKLNDYYKFRLSFKPSVRLCNDKNDSAGNLTKEPCKVVDTAKIYFAENNQASIIIQGTFNYKYNKDGYPVTDNSDIKPFILSSNNLKEIYLSTQHDIPVIIKFD